MSATIKPQGKLTFLTKFAFGMGDFWTSIGNIAMATYLTMFYTDVVRLSPSMVASMLLVVRLVVAFWDLTVGILVDQTKSRWGKARPWMLFGGIAYGIAFLFLFLDPFGNSPAGVIYAWAVYAIVNVAYSTVNVSYASLTSLLTADSGEKDAAQHLPHDHRQCGCHARLRARHADCERVRGNVDRLGRLLRRDRRHDSVRLLVHLREYV